MKTKADRVGIFLRQMDASPPVATMQDAIDQARKIIINVENIHTNFPYDISNWGKGERMYLPPESIKDAWKTTVDFKRADLSGNYFYFHNDGSMALANANTAVVKWAKAGANSCQAPSKGSVHPDKETWEPRKEYVPNPSLDALDALARELKKIDPYEFVDDEPEETHPPKSSDKSLWSRIKNRLKIGSKN